MKLSGCSLIGFSMGSSSDRKEPDRDTLTFRQIADLHTFGKVFLTLRNETASQTQFYRLEAEGTDSGSAVISFRNPDRDSVFRVPFADVQTLAVPHHASAKWYGLGAGLVIDAVVVTVAAVLLSNSMEGMGIGH